jgi:hypothetical protein
MRIPRTTATIAADGSTASAVVLAYAACQSVNLDLTAVTGTSASFTLPAGGTIRGVMVLWFDVVNDDFNANIDVQWTGSTLTIADTSGTDISAVVTNVELLVITAAQAT